MAGKISYLTNNCRITVWASNCIENNLRRRCHHLNRDHYRQCTHDHVWTGPENNVSQLIKYANRSSQIEHIYKVMEQLADHSGWRSVWNNYCTSKSTGTLLQDSAGTKAGPAARCSPPF